MLRDISVYFDEITGLPTLANVQVEVQHLLAGHDHLGIIYVSLEGIEEEFERRLEVQVDVFVGWGRLSRSPKVRFERALFRAINGAVTGIQRERSETRHRLQAEFRRILSREQVTCVFHRSCMWAATPSSATNCSPAARFRASCTVPICSSTWPATRDACSNSTGSAG